MGEENARDISRGGASGVRENESMKSPRDGWVSWRMSEKKQNQDYGVVGEAVQLVFQG